MGMPKWVWVLIAIAVIWFLSDPAGFADFVKGIFDGAGTFMRTVTK